MLPRMKDFKGKRQGPQVLEQISQSGSIASLMQAAARLDRLTQIVQRKLPDHLREHVRVAELQRGLLTLILDDRAYLVETRYLSTTLTQALTTDLPELKNIKWRIARPRPAPRSFPEQIKVEGPSDIDDWLEQAGKRGSAYQKPSDEG